MGRLGLPGGSISFLMALKYGLNFVIMASYLRSSICSLCASTLWLAAYLPKLHKSPHNRKIHLNRARTLENRRKHRDAFLREHIR